MGHSVGMDSRLHSFNISVRFRYRRDYRGRNEDAVVEVFPRLLGGKDDIIYYGSLCRLGNIPGNTLVKLGTLLYAEDKNRPADKVDNAHYQHESVATIGANAVDGIDSRADSAC